MPRFLKNISVQFISLVRKGANQKTIIWKSGDGDPPRSWQVEIAKTDEDKRLVFGIVYSPGEVDSQGDMTDAAEIEKAAYDFLKASRTGDGVDKDHTFTPESGAFVAESWLVRKGDPVFQDQPEGSWGVAIKVDDDVLWDAVKKGEIGGLSMGGRADIEPMGKSTDFNAALSIDGFWKFFNALESSIRSIHDDEAITDKQAAIAASIDQFKEAILAQTPINKGQGSGFLAALKRIVKGESDMNEADVKKIAGELVTEQLAKMEQPIKKEDIVSVVAEATKAIVQPIADRLEKLEKQNPGSGQGEEEINKGVDHVALAAQIVKAYKGA